MRGYTTLDKQKTKKLQEAIKYSDNVFLQQEAQKILDERDDLSFSSSHTIMELSRYLKTFPNGIHTEEADDKFFSLCNDFDALLKYLHHPYTLRHNAEVDDKYFSLCNNSEQKSLYISNFPNGKHVNEAKLKLKEERSRNEEECFYIGCNSLNEFQRYLHTYPEGHFTVEAQSEIERIQTRNRRIKMFRNVLLGINAIIFTIGLIFAVYVFKSSKIVPVTIELENGIFTGYIKNGLKEGHGIIKYNDSTYCEGEWENDYLVYGKKTYSNGNEYEGKWNSGHINGQGVMKYANGDIYEGEWVDDKKEGDGTMKYASGDTYVGAWKSDMRHGEGRMTYSYGEYVGEWKNDLRHGRGKYINADGSYSYEGEYANGDCSGMGTQKWSSGDIYEGEFHKGCKSGYGTYTWPDGNKYCGYWKDGKKDGKGTEYDSNGNIIYNGIWENGKFIKKL